MGKNVTKEKRPKAESEGRGTLRAGAIALLTLVGVGAMVGMAVFNDNAKPNRDMKWFVRAGAVEVAAPARGEGYAADATEADSGSPARINARTGAEILAAAAATQQPPVLAEMSEEADAATAEIAQAPEAPVEEETPTEAEPTPEIPEEPSGAVDESTPEPETPEDGEASGEPEAAPEPEAQVTGPVTLTVTAVGDCTFSGEPGSKSNRRFTECVEESGYDYFFTNVRPLFESDDLTIVNLEGPLTSSPKPRKHGYVFKADPECVKILSGSSVELCNLANNHSLDYGTVGLKDTADILAANGIGYCGFTEAYNAVIKGVRVTALGFTKWDHNVDQITEAVAAARPNCDLLIVNMHWGWERQYDNDDLQKAMGHAAVDAGADLVIGTHPHVYQGIEKYKGRYIVYSLGNFCFAGNANPNDKRCLIFQQSFSFTPGMGIAQANFMDAGINLIPANISSVKDKNDFMPTIMTAEEGAEMLKAVASHSTHFSFSDTLWMKDNYLVAYGLVKPQEQKIAGEEDAQETGEERSEEETPEAEETSEEETDTETPDLAETTV